MVDSDPGVDEPEIILPIEWHASTQQHPVAYTSSPNNSLLAASGIPDYAPLFENAVEEEWLKRNSTTTKVLYTKNCDKSQHVSLLILRNYNRAWRPYLSEFTSYVSSLYLYVPSQYIAVVNTLK